MFKLNKTVGLWSNIKQPNLSEKFAKFEKRVEGTIAEKWVKYWKTVCTDYKEVFVDVIRESREKPSKAILIGTTGALLIYCAKHNPDSTHFRDTYLNAGNNVSLVHHSMLKNDIRDYLQLIERSHNNDLLRYTSFGLFSIIWIDNYGRNCAAYDAQCTYLELGYTGILDRIVDFGFLDTWWGLAKKMTDYDINY